MTDKRFELVYSAQKSDFEPGKRYANPRFFSAVREGVSRVVVVGDWPEVVRAYEAADVPVTVQGATKRTATPSMPSALTVQGPGEVKSTMTVSVRTAEPREQQAGVPIPADWRDLPYLPRSAGEPCLRALASQVSSTPILNKALAIEAIEAELARRDG